MNITELKEKLTKFDEVQACIDFGTHFKISKTPPLYIDVLEWQYRKNTKTITALLEIIEDMQNTTTDINSWLKRMSELKWDDETYAPRFKRCFENARDTLSSVAKKLEGL